MHLWQVFNKILKKLFYILSHKKFFPPDFVVYLLEIQLQCNNTPEPVKFFTLLQNIKLWAIETSIFAKRTTIRRFFFSFWKTAGLGASIHICTSCHTCEHDCKAKPTLRGGGSGNRFVSCFQDMFKIHASCTQWGTIMLLYYIKRMKRIHLHLYIHCKVVNC